MSFVLMSFCLWKKKFLYASIAAFLFIFNIGSIIDFEETIQAAGHTRAPFNVYSSNVHLSNRDLSGLTREINKLTPEIVLLLEVTPEHLKQLRPVIQSYPYHIERIFNGKMEIGFVFLSRFPVLDTNITALSDVCNFMLEAKIEVDQKPVMFYAVHEQRQSLENFDERKKQFIDLARRIKGQSLPIVVAGDLNSTPYSPTFQQLIKASGLRDSRKGFGWQPSWPTHLPLFWIPIDHILVSPGIQVLNRSTGSHIGSDHYPVVAELSIQG